MQRLKLLRKEKKITAKQLSKELQVAESTISMYENGKRQPDFNMLLKIADYFGVSIDYLLGKEDKEKKLSEKNNLTEHEQNIINAYRLQPHLQEAVDRVLGIEKNGKILLFEAALSESNRPAGYVYKDKETWDKIKKAPDTDQDLT